MTKDKKQRLQRYAELDANPALVAEFVFRQNRDMSTSSLLPEPLDKYAIMEEYFRRLENEPDLDTSDGLSDESGADEDTSSEVRDQSNRSSLQAIPLPDSSSEFPHDEEGDKSTEPAQEEPESPAHDDPVESGDLDSLPVTLLSPASFSAKPTRYDPAPPKTPERKVKVQNLSVVYSPTAKITSTPAKACNKNLDKSEFAGLFVSDDNSDAEAPPSPLASAAVQHGYEAMHLGDVSRFEQSPDLVHTLNFDRPVRINTIKTGPCGAKIFVYYKWFEGGALELTLSV